MPRFRRIQILSLQPFFPTMFSLKIKGYFMLFRILPVMVWSFTTTLIGTALAYTHTHEIKWLPFLLVLLTAAVIQGFPTHVLNEIYDWKSGADGRDLRSKKSGGSKVLQAKLLTISDLWFVFFISHLFLTVLIIGCVAAINVKILFFLLPGYFSGLLYSLPPFRFAYRPFLGEWLGGFMGIFFLMLGSYYAQSQTVNSLVVLNACALALVYIGIMIFFHYLDYENDQQAVPEKRTTVVFLGLHGSRRYAYGCLAGSVLLFSICIFKSETQGVLLLLLSLVILLSHYRADLSNSSSIIKWGKVITFATLILGVSFASLANPLLISMAVPATFGFWAHKKFGKLPGSNLQPNA